MLVTLLTSWRTRNSFCIAILLPFFTVLDKKKWTLHSKPRLQRWHSPQFLLLIYWSPVPCSILPNQAYTIKVVYFSVILFDFSLHLIHAFMPWIAHRILLSQLITCYLIIARVSRHCYYYYFYELSFPYHMKCFPSFSFVY